MNRGNGFTLIELVLVIVMLSILSLGFVGFIKMGSQIYQNVASRSSLSSEASFVLERLNKELRNALPHSIRVLDDGLRQCLQFIPIKSVQVYSANRSSKSTSTNNNNSNENSTRKQLYILKGNSDIDLKVQDRVVLSSPKSNDGYDINSNKTVEISALEVKPTHWLVTLTKPIALAADLSKQYLHVVDKPISYCAANGLLKRVADNDYQRQQIIHQNGDLMAENIDLSSGLPFVIDYDFLQFTKVQINLSYKKHNHRVVLNSGVNIRHEP